MTTSIPISERLKDVTSYLVSLVLCVFLLAILFRLPSADLKIPLSGGSDSLFYEMLVKNVMDNGWYLHTDRLGAPYGMDLHDFPMFDSLHWMVIKLIAVRSDDPILIVNLFYLLTFLLSAASAHLVFRRFDVPRQAAVAVSLLFAFMPFHFFRGTKHLFLSAYYVIPLTVMLILWVYLGRLQRDLSSELGDPRAKFRVWARWMLAIGICVLTASSGLYYAFFGCFFLLAAGIGSAVRQKKIAPLLSTVVLIAVICVGLGVNSISSLRYLREHGGNTQVAHRNSLEAEIYGLKLTQLVLPVTDHRLRFLANVKRSYNVPHRPLVNDFGSSLGMVGTLAFLYLLGSLIFQRSEVHPLVQGLSLLTICGVLLGTVGGLGALFAFLISPQIRCYDRISIYLGFICLFGAAWLLGRYVNEARSRAGRVGACALCGFCLVVGIWDQVPRFESRPFAALRSEVASDAEFAAAVEQALPSGSAILQLPYVGFPEFPNVHNMQPYDHFRPYLHSRTVRWSHGAVHGRDGAEHLSALCQGAVEEKLTCVAAMGYLGIHIDRRGYPDEGRRIEAALKTALGAEPLVSANRRDVFFNLVPFVSGLENGCTPQEPLR